MKRILPLLAIAALSPSLWAQKAHPRIWLDSTTLTRLNALMTSNDATWVALKAQADNLASQTVEPYSASSCAGSDICYTYEGLGWLAAVEPLALAYQMTGSTTYSNQVKAVLNSFATAGAAPCEVDAGYPSRSAVLALALGYDWIYPTLSSTDKANYTTVLDACWTWVQAHGYEWNVSSGGAPNGYGNYFGGHVEGYGLAALAVEGDDTNSSSMQSAVLSNFNTYVVPAVSSGGGFNGGFAVQGYNYGGNNFLRLVGYMLGMHTGDKIDLFTTYENWIETIAQNTLYEEQPDDWSIMNEGDWPNNAANRVMYQSLPYDLAGMITGTMQGGWLLSLYNHMTTPPDAISSSLYVPTAFELFLYNTGQSAVDYTATQPVYYFSPGDNHTHVRTDWTTSAIKATFNGGSGHWIIDHEAKNAGHVSVQRGSDYLLVGAGMWAGTDGVTGTPQADDIANWHSNTLFYWDGGTDCLNQTDSTSAYAGCQGYWGTLNTIKHKEGTGFAFQESPIQTAYNNNIPATTITAYTRSFVSISGIAFIFDRITAPSTSTRMLEWHTAALNTATVPGNATALSLSGTIGTATVGSSKLWIDTLLPSSPTITQATDATYYSSGVNVGTQAFQVVDPNASNCSTNCLFLTVLAATATGASQPTMSLISVTGYDGAFYNDSKMPRIALFSVDGTQRTSVTYTASYSSDLTGTHIITDLTPGTYIVTKDASIIVPSITVANDGSLEFSSAGGGTAQFQIQPSTSFASGPPGEPEPPAGLSASVQ